MGADAKSRVFYNRVKGELEEALARLTIEGLIIARPSLLTGDREALDQQGRPAEMVATTVSRSLGPLVPANYRPVAAAEVARALFAEYRAELYKLPDALGIKQWSGACICEDIGSVRKAVRAAIENTVRERNGTWALLRSFTTLSGYEAVETLNRQKYKGHDDWELRAGGVARFRGNIAEERMTVLEAVDTAVLLRREEHVARRAPVGGHAV